MTQSLPDELASDVESVLSLSRLGPILAIHFLGTLGFSLVYPFLVFIVADLGGAAWTYGLLGATYSTFQLWGAPVLGRWSDRTGRRPVLVASQLGTLVAWLLFFVALSLPEMRVGMVRGATVTVSLLMIFFARALDGATGGNVSVANAYVADLTRDAPTVRQRAFGRMGMAGNLGFVIGPAVAGLLGTTAWGPRLPVAVAALFAAATSVAIVTTLREPSGRCPEGPPPAGTGDLSQQIKPCHTAPEPGAMRRGIADGAARRVLAATALLFLAFNFFYAGFPVHAKAVFGWSSGQLGAFFAVLSVSMVVAQGPVLSAVSSRLTSRVVFGLGIGILALAFALFQVRSTVAAYAGATLFAIGNGLSWPTFQARVAEIGRDAQGAVQGAVTSVSSLSAIVGLVSGAMLYPIVGGALFVVGAGLFFVVLVLTPLWFSDPPAEGASAS